MKSAGMNDEIRMQSRVEVFDLFNHVEGTPGCGTITNPHFLTGESISLGQTQLSFKFIL
jgi:hypothetical protein